jgi:hypothetical protein
MLFVKKKKLVLYVIDINISLFFSLNFELIVFNFLLNFELISFKT